MNTEVRFLAQHLLHAGLSPLNARDRRVIARVARRVHTARNLNREFDDRLTLGQRLADRVAVIGGSWGFIAGFGIFLVAWALLNATILAEHAFDPYPFVFLNLLLSMLAALQAPIIMMSQNRQAAKDRLAAALDYEVNLKSETEIASLHDKVDKLQTQIEQIVALQTSKVGAPALAPDNINLEAGLLDGVAAAGDAGRNHVAAAKRMRSADKRRARSRVDAAGPDGDRSSGLSPVRHMLSR